MINLIWFSLIFVIQLNQSFNEIFIYIIRQNNAYCEYFFFSFRNRKRRMHRVTTFLVFLSIFLRFFKLSVPFPSEVTHNSFIKFLYSLLRSAPRENSIHYSCTNIIFRSVLVNNVLNETSVRNKRWTIFAVNSLCNLICLHNGIYKSVKETNTEWYNF